MIEFSSRNIRLWSMLGASGTFGLAVYELAGRDSDLAIVTSDLCTFSGLEKVRTDYPDVIYNVGIAEQNMIGVAAGMSKEGMHVWATTYASFASTRDLDQVRVNMGYMKIPIRLVGMACGYSVGSLGATHMAIEDIAIMRSIPNITVISPADNMEAMKAIMAVSEMDYPVYLRMSGALRTPIVYKEDYKFEVGKAIEVLPDAAAEISMIATGSMVNHALLAAKLLAVDGIAVRVINMHTIKPIDVQMIMSCIGDQLVVTVEEHNCFGGLGSAVAEVLSGYKRRPPQLILGIEDFYPAAGSYGKLLEISNLTPDAIAKKVRDKLKV